MFDAAKADADLNQYWYSDKTIEKMVSEIEMHATKCAFLSTPSLFFALTNEKIRANSKVFEFDKQWEKDPGFVFYDFNAPEKVPVDLWGAFDYVVVDPPFITKEVWEKYIATVKLILAKDGKVLFTSVIENHPMLETVFDVTLMIPKYRPSIPKLTYQYHCFTNYEATQMQEENTELPAEDPTVRQAMDMANCMRESEYAFAAQMKSRDRTKESPIIVNETMKWNHVPEGLTEYANGASAPPEQQESIDFGPEYTKLMDRRNTLEDFKKGVDRAQKILDLALQAKLINHEEDYQKALKEREDHLTMLGGLKQRLHDYGDAKDIHSICPVIEECIAAYAAVPIEKEKLLPLSADATRLFKSPVFARQRELLAEIKKTKQDFLKKKREEEKAAAAAGEGTS